MEAFYTSKDVRSLEGLGYTYPELISWQGLTQAEKLTKINQMYRPSVEYTEGYRLHVTFDGIAKHRLNGSFSINVFVGYDSADYVVSASTPTKDNPHFAGSVSIFASSNAASNKCANCRRPDRQHVRGSVDLTSALLKVGGAIGINPAELVEDEGDPDARQPWARRPALGQQLAWDRVQQVLLDNIQWVALKPNGAQVHHVAVEEMSITWTRPYKLTANEQRALLRPMPDVAPAAAAADVPLAQHVQLPAPMANHVAARLRMAAPNAAGGAVAAAAADDGGAVGGALAAHFSDLLFVATSDLAAVGELCAVGNKCVEPAPDAVI